MLIILDGTNLVRRTYHAGGTGSIERTAERLACQYGGEVVVAWDAKHPYWRHALYPDYKAHRLDDPRAQDFVRNAARAARGAGLVGYYADAMEADDVAATLVAASDDECIAVSSDKDWCQMLADGARWLTPDGGFEERTAQSVWDRYGVGPSLWPDFVALAGDSSDGIPGVPRIGPVRAAKILSEYGSCEAFAAAVLDPAGIAAVETYKQIATLRRDAEVRRIE